MKRTDQSAERFFCVLVEQKNKQNSNRRYKMNHCKTIAIVNQKGGVGKTTSTVNLGVGLAQAGNRVLLVDDDPQHSLTISLGIRNADEALDTTLATAMQAEIRDEPVPWEDDIIHSGEGVDLLPANIELSGVEMSLFNAMSREQVLKSVLSRVKENYDYILIDCMPSLGLMSVNALAAADSVIIPSAPDFLSTKGLNLLIRTISRVRRQINAMPYSYRQAIALTLLYSRQLWNSNYSVKTTAMGNNPNVSTRIATQFLIYEIVTGLRDADTFNRRGSNGYTSGDVFYNAGVASVSGFAEKYNSIVSSVQNAMKIPSFTSRSSGSAPTITMSGSQVSVTDSNGVLGNFSFTNGNGASFSKSGNTLTITKTGSISPSTVFSATRSLPSAENSTVSIYYSASSTYQTCVKLYSPQVDTLRAYFKINAPDPGAIALVKTTEDGQNLSGWRFGVYTNAACTTLVSGPHTTNSNGKISITGLNVGTYYVKELGHTNSGISSRYTCSGENPKMVSISNGTTTSVSFYNKLSSGSVKITKTTNTGQNLGGWKIGLYTDSACTNPISGSPFTTGSDGTVTVSGLQPGILYAKELASSDPYWICDTSVRTVTVVAGQTASVSFSNTQYGVLEIRKSTNTGNHLDGWKFIVKKDGTEIPGSPFTTDETGIIRISNLAPGKYLVLESPTEDPYWSGELGYHTVTVEYGKTAVDQWLNKEQGLGYFTKSTNTGDEISGWHITVYADEACTQELRTFITGQDGTVGVYLEPGTYWVKETGSEEVRDDFWKMDDSVKKLVIRAHEKTTLEFINNYSGRISIQKTVKPEGTLEGWKFKITDADGKEVSGSPFTTDKDGKILTGNLTPGDYTVEEVLPADSLYSGEAPKTVTEIQTANGYTLLKNAITVTISLKENPAKPCNVYAKDVLGVLQNDPHYAFDGGENLKLANIPQRALSHNYPTASATVDKNDVTMLEDNGSANAEVPLSVKNTKGFDLPKTGDHGTWMYSLVGILLMSTAAGVIVLTVKKKNGR